MPLVVATEAPHESTVSSRERRLGPPRRRIRKGAGAALFLVPALGLYSLFALWPIVQLFWLALHQWDGYGPQRWVGAANAGALLGDPQFHTALAHTALWEVGAIVVAPLLGLALALLAGASRLSILPLAALFFPALLPPTAVAALWVLILSPLSGPLNAALRASGLGAAAQNWLGDPHLALLSLFTAWLWSSLGVSVLLFWAGLTSIGSEYGDIARLEGAGRWWRFAHVTVPALRRTIGVAVVVNAALGVQVFDLIFVTTGGGPGYATLTLPLDMYGRAFNGRVGEGAAVACTQVVLGLALAGIALVLGHDRGESFQSHEPRASMRASGPAAWISMAALLLILAAFLLPLGWLLQAALEPGRSFAFGGSHVLVDPQSWTGTNITTVWSGGMGQAIVRSTSVGVVVVLLVLTAAAPAAFALAHRLHGAARRVVLLLLLIGLLQPTSVVMIPLFSLLGDLHLLGTEWGIVLPEAARALPLTIVLLWGWFQQSPREVLEAARVDGASSTAQLTRIALPLARPALVTAAVWTFVGSWNEYLLPTLVSQDGSLPTVPTLLASYIGSYNTQFGLLAAGTALAMLPSAALYLLLRRPAATGLTPVENAVR